MAIELSNLTFTDEADIVPASGVEEILNQYDGITNTLAGDDIITGIGISRYIFLNYGTLNTGDGNDILTGIHNPNGIPDLAGAGFRNSAGSQSPTAVIDTGNGNDTISGIARRGAGIVASGGIIKTGDGNDTITGNAINVGISVLFGTIDAGDGNDTITGTAVDFGIRISSDTINTGKGNDTITGIGSIGIYNDGTINTGSGQDSIITDGGFDGMGSVFLENGKDYLKGFGSGIFNGGNGEDTLELTSGIYTVGISGTAVNFTKGSIIMNTSDFEKLQAGDITYNFNSLINGQTIIVA
jgi:hypothetical protein